MFRATTVGELIDELKRYAPDAALTYAVDVNYYSEEHTIDLFIIDD